tara:strand:- start:69 stop:689 length:621 start_codon:yes stop_codon:yes gene_type:complete
MRNENNKGTKEMEDLTFKYKLLKAVKGVKVLVERDFVVDLNEEGGAEFLTDWDFVKFADMALDTSVSLGVRLNYEGYVTSGYWTGRTSSYNMLYGITVDGKVAKIGMTTAGLSKRWGSYNNGTEEIRLKGSGSTTNYNVIQPLKKAIEEGRKVEWFSYQCPVHRYVNEGFGVTEEVVAKDPEWYENILITKYEEEFGKKPFLSQNK